MKKTVKIIFLTLVIAALTANVQAKESVWQQNPKLSFSGGSRTVNAVYVDLNDKTIRMESVYARNQIGQVDDLKNIAELAGIEERQVIAAINGTFFNAYTDMQPWCNIESKGQFVHMGALGSVIGFSADNKVMTENLYVSIKGAINGVWEYPYNWDAWGFNHRYDAADANVVYTPAFGKSTGKHSNTSVVVDKGIVTSICKGEAAISPDGYTMVFGSAELAGRFHKGDRVDYTLEFNKINFTGSSKKGAAVKWDNVRTAVGAGPTLLKDGKILADAKLEGFTEDKIHTSRAQRSFAGVTKDNVLIMGTAPNVTVKELAEIAKKMGIVNGINLDGGASSGLYFKGKYVTQPGRKLSNALVVTRLKEQPIRIKLNGKEVFCTSDPFVLKPQNSVMVPLKGIFQALGAKVDWNAQSKAIVVKKGSLLLEVKSGSDIASINGKQQKMNAPITTHYSNSFISLEFVVGLFKGSTRWEGTKLADITIENINAGDVLNLAKQAEQKGDAVKAEELYLKVLELEPEHAGGCLRLALLYAGQKNYEQAVQYYEKYLVIQPYDYSVRNQMGWSYYSMGNMDMAARTFGDLTEMKPETPDYWIALGAVYNSYSVKKYEEAEECFNKALTLKLTQKQKDDIARDLEYTHKMMGTGS